MVAASEVVALAVNTLPDATKKRFEKDRNLYPSVPDTVMIQLSDVPDVVTMLKLPNASHDKFTPFVTF
jgi:hypothetical protein